MKPIKHLYILSNSIYLSIYTIGAIAMKTAKLFQNGQSQAVRLPKEFRLEGKEVFIKKMGDAIILLPTDHQPWKALFASLDKFSHDFMSGTRKQPKIQTRDNLL